MKLQNTLELYIDCCITKGKNIEANAKIRFVENQTEVLG